MTGGRRILIAGDDVANEAAARAALSGAGVESVCVPSLAAARDALAAAPFDAAVVDVRLGTEDALQLVRELRGGDARMPIVALSPDGAFAVKIEALRAGADAVLETPVDWASLGRSVLSLLDAARRPARILVVDDDLVSTAVIRGTLAGAGYEVGTCSRPERFEEALREVRPDLILMDIELPKISGFDLARYVRRDERFETVPLIYVTGAVDDDRALAVAGSGGEQILRKPVPAEVLLATIAGRLEHFRRLRMRMDRDAVTGVLTRRPFLERVDEAVAAIRRAPERHFTFAFLDVDHFKEINDQYGHAAGDRVLAALGDALRRGTRATDAVGRVGGEEFAILLADTAAGPAVQMVERLLQTFAGMRQPVTAETSVTVTFSAGIAELMPGETSQSWLARADEALYEAKNAGRNCARVAAAAPAGTAAEELDGPTIAGLRELGETAGQDVIRELAALFFTSVPERIAAIRAALDARDAHALRREAHALHSAAGNLGATTMQLCCAELEEMGKSAAWDSAVACAVRLDAAWERSRLALAALLER